MRLRIDDIKIGSRIRYTAGDISTLKDSIHEIGLLNPVLVNEKHELISGFRRLEACRQLGWAEVEVKVIPTAEDNVKMLDLEFHENVGRLNLSAEELQHYSQTRETLLHPPKTTRSFMEWLNWLWEALLSFFSRFNKQNS